MSDCPRHEDTIRRVSSLERHQEEQTRENAKIWRAVNVIREEKATDSTILRGLVTSVDAFSDQLVDGLLELRGEIQDLKLQPAKRWEMIVASIVSAVVSMIIGVAATLTLSGKTIP